MPEASAAICWRERQPVLADALILVHDQDIVEEAGNRRLHPRRAATNVVDRAIACCRRLLVGLQSLFGRLVKVAGPQLVLPPSPRNAHRARVGVEQLQPIGGLGARHLKRAGSTPRLHTGCAPVQPSTARTTWVANPCSRSSTSSRPVMKTGPPAGHPSGRHRLHACRSGNRLTQVEWLLVGYQILDNLDRRPAQGKWVVAAFRRQAGQRGRSGCRAGQPAPAPARAPCALTVSYCSAIAAATASGSPLRRA
jgi:hypothetical protein